MMVGYIESTAGLVVAVVIAASAVALMVSRRRPQCGYHWRGPIPGKHPVDGVVSGQIPRHVCMLKRWHRRGHQCQCGSIKWAR